MHYDNDRLASVSLMTDSDKTPSKRASSSGAKKKGQAPKKAAQKKKPAAKKTAPKAEPKAKASTRVEAKTSENVITPFSVKSDKLKKKMLSWFYRKG